MAIGTSLLFSDDFNRADDPTGLGSDYTEDTEGSNVSSWEIISNEATGEITSGTSGEANWAYVKTSVFTPTNADYKLVCDTVGTTANRTGFWLRLTGSGATVSGYKVYRNGENTIVIDRVVSGVTTNLVSQFEGTSLWDTKWTIEIEDIAGDPTITVTTLAGGEIVTYTDTNAAKITAIGTIGLVFRTSSSSGIVYAWDNLQAFGTGGTPVADVDFYISGDVSATGATVALRSSTGDPIKLEYSTSSDFSGSSTTGNQTPVAGNDYMLDFVLSGLTADTKYYFRAIQNDTANALITGSVRTGVAKGQAHTFTYGFASCAQNGSIADVFGRAEAHDPLFFLQGGDLHYSDIVTNNVSLYRAAYQDVFGSAVQSMLYGKVSLMYMWDDHDYADNNSGSSAVSKPAAQATYREYIPQTLELGSGAIYYANTNGRVKFIVPDLRSERAGIELMSATQQTWFEAELTDSSTDPDIQVTVVWMSCPWIATGEGDTWSDAAVQRTEIADHIYSLGIENNIVFIGGDMHAIAYDDGTNNVFDTSAQTGWPVYQSAAMDQTGSIKGGPYSFAASTGGGRYTMMEIADTGGTSITLTTTGYGAADAVIYTDVVVMTSEAVASGSGGNATKSLSISSLRIGL